MPSPTAHILFNALFLAPSVSGGPETYLRGLVPALAAEHPELRLTVATTQSGRDSLRASGWQHLANVVALPCEDGQRLRRQLAEQMLLPALARREHADILHSLASLAPAFPRTRSVVTLHDVTFMQTPTFGAVTTWGMARLVRRAGRRADGLIAGSAAARDQICTELGLDSARFTVIHHGYEPARVAVATPAVELRRRLGLGARRVVLCVAAKRPHKNQELLVRAAQLLGGDVAIVLVGHPEPYEQRLRELSHELSVADRVYFVGYVSEADLEGLWALADCFAFPTLGEGFGIPVIEALAHGVPVAVSDIPVLREVGADLPRYFDPHDAAAAARAIWAALDDDTVSTRGPEYAARYTWAAAARSTYEVYRRVLEGEPAG